MRTGRLNGDANAIATVSYFLALPEMSVATSFKRGRARRQDRLAEAFYEVKWFLRLMYVVMSYC